MKKSIFLSVILMGFFIFSSCSENKKSEEVNKQEIKTQNEQQATQKPEFDKEIQQFVGTWAEQIPNSDDELIFKLNSDGTAESVNMATLLYKKWKLDGDKIIFTVESIGNHTSSTDDYAYKIESIDKKEMILTLNGNKFVYKRK